MKGNRSKREAPRAERFRWQHASRLQAKIAGNEEIAALHARQSGPAVTSGVEVQPRPVRPVVKVGS